MVVQAHQTLLNFLPLMKIKQMKNNNIKVIKDSENPETPEVLASSLIKISEAFERFAREPGITQEGLIALLQNMKGMNAVGKREITLVLENLKRLKSYYVRNK